MNAIRTGLTSVTFRQKTIDEIVALAHMAQLDGIEWGGDLHVPAGDVQAARHAAKATADAGLSVLSYGSYFHGDEGEDFGRKLKEAGNQVEVHQIKDALHGFFALGIQFLHVRESFTYMNAFLQKEA